jgi:hypothetical protein
LDFKTGEFRPVSNFESVIFWKTYFNTIASPP